MNLKVIESYEIQPLWVKLWTIQRLRDMNDFDTLEAIKEQEDLCLCGNNKLAEAEVCGECL